MDVCISRLEGVCLFDDVVGLDCGPIARCCRHSKDEELAKVLGSSLAGFQMS